MLRNVRLRKSQRKGRRRRKTATGLHTLEGIAGLTRNGFGMPPATTDQATTWCVSGVGERDIERGIVTIEGTTTTGERKKEEPTIIEDTLEDNLQDKYFYALPRHEFESPKANGSPNVMGRLKARVSQWEKMGASEYILQTLETGYKLPLLDTPGPPEFKNNKSALRNADFVETAIDELLESGRIIKL